MLYTLVELVETPKKAKSKYKDKGQVNSNDCVADYVCQKNNHISQSTITEKTETSVAFLKSKLR